MTTDVRGMGSGTASTALAILDFERKRGMTYACADTNFPAQPYYVYYTSEL